MDFAKFLRAPFLRNTSEQLHQIRSIVAMFIIFVNSFSRCVLKRATYQLKLIYENLKSQKNMK